MADSVISDSAGHHYRFGIEMSCGGCSGAIERVLKKTAGITSYDVSLERQSADVYTEPSVTYEAILDKIKKTGKAVTTGEADGLAKAV